MGAQSEAMTISAWARGTAAFTHRPLLQSKPSSPVVVIFVLSDLIARSCPALPGYPFIAGTAAEYPRKEAAFRRSEYRMHISACQRNNCRERTLPHTAASSSRFQGSSVDFIGGILDKREGSLKKCPFMKYYYSKCDIYKLFVD
jgi:hypothetical protein